MSREIHTLYLGMLEMTPLSKARLEIFQLSSDPDYIEICVLGRPKTAAEIQQNKEIAAKRQRKEVEIIKKYDVAEQFLNPLYVKRALLMGELSEIESEIAELEA